MRKLLSLLIVLAAIVGTCIPASAQYGGCLGACRSIGGGGVTTTTWNLSDKSKIVNEQILALG